MGNIDAKSRLRLELTDERGQACEWCGKPASQLHHCIIGDKKSHKKLLFCKENLIVMCHDCNVSRRFDNEWGRQYWWGVQCKRYGQDHMIEWLDEIHKHFKTVQFVPVGDKND